jgi:invasion protein IalB
MKQLMASRGRRFAAAYVVALAGALGIAGAGLAQDATPPAWHVECTGDGKVLECRAVQQVINRDERQVVAQLSVRLPSGSKTPTMLIQLPLGLSLAEPVQLKIDAGPDEKLPFQTCTAAGCFVGMPLNDKFLAAMRSGTTLKLTFQDSNKRPITADVPLLGFGLAFDKAK